MFAVVLILLLCLFLSLFRHFIALKGTSIQTPRELLCVFVFHMKSTSGRL